MEFQNLDQLRQHLEKVRSFYLPYAEGTTDKSLDKATSVIILALLATMRTVDELATKAQEGDKL